MNELPRLKNFAVPYPWLETHNQDGMFLAANKVLKYKGLVPEDAEFVLSQRLITQNVVVFQYRHPSFKVIQGCDLIPVEVVELS